MQTLADLVRKAGSSVKVLAGGGITLENVADVIEETGVDEVHALSSVSSTLIDSSSAPNLFHSPRKVAHASEVRRMVRLLEGLPRK